MLYGPAADRDDKISTPKHFCRNVCKNRTQFKNKNKQTTWTFYIKEQLHSFLSRLGWVPHSPLWPLLRESVGRASSQLKGVTQHPSWSGDFPGQRGGTRPSGSLSAPGQTSQNTCHLRPEWHRCSALAFVSPLAAPQPHLHPPHAACEESGTLKEKWINFCSICSIWGTKTTVPLFDFWKLKTLSCSPEMHLQSFGDRSCPSRRRSWELQTRFSCVKTNKQKNMWSYL